MLSGPSLKAQIGARWTGAGKGRQRSLRREYSRVQRKTLKRWTGPVAEWPCRQSLGVWISSQTSQWEITEAFCQQRWVLETSSKHLVYAWYYTNYEGLQDETNHRRVICSQQSQTFAIATPSTCHASPQAGSPEESGDFPASAIHHSSGLTVGEGIGPLEGMVFTLWFLWNPRASPEREVGRWTHCMLHFDTELTFSDLGRQG